ncbi:hypothetical protein [Kitasatospora sp. NPDC093679]|uniref:hypothetical protein n=1 Tax=Kitasatospora sp. NPDC093679 TaxID=3154983 RepID=UPI00343406E0
MWIMFTMESPGSRRRLGTLPTDLGVLPTDFGTLPTGGVSAGIRPDAAGRACLTAGGVVLRV